MWGVRAIEVYAKSLGLGTDLTLKDSPKFVGLTVPIELANFNIKLSAVGTFLKIQYTCKSNRIYFTETFAGF